MTTSSSSVTSEVLFAALEDGDVDRATWAALCDLLIEEGGDLDLIEGLRWCVDNDEYPVKESESGRDGPKEWWLYRLSIFNHYHNSIEEYVFAREKGAEARSLRGCLYRISWIVRQNEGKQ